MLDCCFKFEPAAADIAFDLFKLNLAIFGKRCPGFDTVCSLIRTCPPESAVGLVHGFQPAVVVREVDPV